ncbi:MAG: phenylalanine--tRNA ligase subunit beta [Acidimicrobiales bacterium]
MLVPLSWLRDFAPFDLDPVALGEVFDDLGMVVEAMTRVGEGLDDVVVATVLSVESIEGADKIRKVLVDAGDPEATQIVCGAWNFGVGDSVPLARVGAVLPGDFAIARRKMRGVVSDGMLCSGREIGIGDDAAGLLILPAGMSPGEPLASALGITPDVVYDLAIEANRPDANCVAGVARDAAARLGLPFALPTPLTPVAAPSAGATNSSDAAVRVAVEDHDLCDRFTASVFTGVAVAPSPAWVVRRLALAGMRAISNVVDASNYVMLELGQPTHAYDLDRLPGAELRARAARPGERLTTLDGVERVLGDGRHPDCVITDGADVVIGIAGIMGGASSEVHAGTTSVVLEAAHFVPMAIARTSKRIGLRSEASARFERGVDVGGVERSVARFAEVLRESNPSLAALGATVDHQGPGALTRPVIRLRTDRLNAMLGTALAVGDVERLLTPIGFEVAATADGISDVVAPTFRPDAMLEIDLIEEVARHHGYAKIARSSVRPAQVGRLTPYQLARRRLRAALVGGGLSEAMTSPLVAPGDHARTGLAEDGIEAVDPLVREESILRSSLLPGLLRAVRFNADRRNPDVGLFEVGKTWRPPHPSSDGVSPGPDSEPGRGLPDEREMVALVLGGSGPKGVGGGADGAVGVLRRLHRALGLDAPTLDAAEAPGMHPTRTAEIIIGGVCAGLVGEVDPAVVAGWGLEGRIGWCELDLQVLLRSVDGPRPSRPVSKFPSSDLDLAFVVPDQVAAGAVEETLRHTAADLAEWVQLFDVYRGTGVAEGSRSLAFRLRLVAADRTLSDADLAAVRQHCIDAVEAAHSARLRS